MPILPDKWATQIQALQQLTATSIELPPLLILMKKIPFFSAFIRHINNAKDPIATLITLHGAIPSQPLAASGIPIILLILSAINFLFLPFLFLAFKIAKVEPPLNLTHFGHWVASTIILGLLIAALLIPGVAPILTLIVASVSLVVALSTIRKSLLYQTQLQKTIDDNLLAQTTLLAACDTLVSRIKAYTTSNDPHLAAFEATAQAEFDRYKEQLQALKNQEATCKTMRKTNDTTAVIYRSSIVIFSLLSVIGLALCFAFPVVGLSLMAIGSTLTGLFFLGRLAVMIHTAWKNRNMAAPPVNAPPVHESTLDIEQRLQPHFTNWPHQVTELKEIYQNQDHQKAVTFFKTLSTVAETVQLSHEELQKLLQQSDLEKVLNWYQANPEHKDEQDLYTPLKNILRPKPPE